MDLDGISQLALNLRWIVRQAERRPELWVSRLSLMTRKTIGRSRALGLLLGAEAEPDEVRVLEDVTGHEREELISVPLYSRDLPLFAHNLRHLVEAIPHGQAKVAAARIGITEGQLSRWKKWGEGKKPHSTNLRKLLKFHGMDSDLDLEEVPIFLSMEPLSGYAQKEWVSSRVQEMPASEVAKIYPALKKLLRYDEED